MTIAECIVLGGLCGATCAILGAGRLTLGAKHSLAYYRSKYEHYRRLAELYHAKSDWAEMYAGQLEKELGVPAFERMNGDSWKAGNPDFRRFNLEEEGE